MANGGIIGPPNGVNPPVTQCAVTHTKTSSGTITTAALTTSVNVLVVGGGGGGARDRGGGGAGGGYRFCSSVSVIDLLHTQL